MFSNLNFLYPQLFLALPIVLALLIKKNYGRKKNQAIYFPLLKKVSSKSQGDWRVKLSRLVPFLLQFAIYTLIIILLARPQLTLQKEKIKKKGVDIIFTLDVSGSMLAEDLTPNRIERAKKVLAGFLPKLEGDRAGIVVFSGIPFTQVPLTLDHATLSKHLQKISTDSISSRIGGTLIGDAIISAVDVLSKEKKEVNPTEKNSHEKEEKKSKEKKREKVIILITDGEQSKKGIKPEIAAQYAEEKNIKIYCVGIGKIGGAPIVYMDEFGNKRTAKDIFGQVQYTKLDEETLKNITKIAKGKYFRATDDQSLEKIFRDIRQLTQQEIEVESYTEYRDLVFPFGILLLIFIPLDFVLRRTFFYVIR